MRHHFKQKQTTSRNTSMYIFVRICMCILILATWPARKLQWWSCSATANSHQVAVQQPTAISHRWMREAFSLVRAFTYTCTDMCAGAHVHAHAHVRMYTTCVCVHHHIYTDNSEPSVPHTHKSTFTQTSAYTRVQIAEVCMSAVHIVEFFQPRYSMFWRESAAGLTPTWAPNEIAASGCRQSQLCMYIYIYIFMHTYVYTCTGRSQRPQKQWCVCVCVCVFVCTYIHTHTCMYIHIHIYIRIDICKCMPIHMYTNTHRARTYVHMFAAHVCITWTTADRTDLASCDAPRLYWPPKDSPRLVS